MLKDMLSIFTDRADFFWELLLEHLEIALVSILIAILFGGLVGILISEFPKAARPALGVINFLYTIPSISMLGFLIPFSGVGNATAIICIAADGTQYAHGCYECRPLYFGSGERYGKHKAQILFKIKLPLAMPVIMSGVRNMVTMTIALAGIASFIGAGGLGSRFTGALRPIMRQ